MAEFKGLINHQLSIELKEKRNVPFLADEMFTKFFSEDEKFCEKVMKKMLDLIISSGYSEIKAPNKIVGHYLKKFFGTDRLVLKDLQIIVPVKNGYRIDIELLDTQSNKSIQYSLYPLHREYNNELTNVKKNGIRLRGSEFMLLYEARGEVTINVLLQLEKHLGGNGFNIRMGITDITEWIPLGSKLLPDANTWVKNMTVAVADFFKTVAE
jgi:hypothetical protein